MGNVGFNFGGGAKGIAGTGGPSAHLPNCSSSSLVGLFWASFGSIAICCLYVANANLYMCGEKLK